MNNPLVSVLINNYNYDQFLDEAIQSALAQTYKNIEIIIVDDGSNDSSRKVIEKYGLQAKILFKENGGQGSAFNAGFELSKGAIVCLLDADDIWFSSKVEKIVDGFSQCQDTSVVSHRVQNIDSLGQACGMPWPPYPAIKGDISEIVAKYGGWWPFSPSTGLSFSRKFLREVLPIPEDKYRICADTYLADLAPFFGDVVTLEEPLSGFRIHNSNNWSHGEGLQERNAYYHKLRSEELNRVLLDKKTGLRVSLGDNLPYLGTMRALGKPVDVLKLSYLELTNPWNPRPLSRVKASLKRWIPKV